MKLKGDYHTHTCYSHGVGTIEENVKSAIEKKLEFIVISDHGPMSEYGITKENHKEMRFEIDILKNKYKDQIEILLGIEANIMDTEGNLDIDVDFFAQSDIILAGFHFDIVYKEELKEIRKKLDRRFRLKNHIDSNLYQELEIIYTQSTIKAMEKYDIQILTHLGDKYPIDIELIAAKAQETNTYLEINNFHRYLNYLQINKITKYQNLKFVVNSDAHRPRDVGNVKTAIKILEKSNLDIKRVVNLE